MNELQDLWPDEDRRDQALDRIADRLSGLTPQQNRSLQPTEDLQKLRLLIGDNRSRVELSATELRVLQALASGLNRDETAQVLGYTLETVKSQLKQARRILGAKTTVQAVAIALRDHLIV